MSFDDDMIAAYVDGAVDAEGRARVEAAATTDPALARRIAAQRDLRALLTKAYAPLLVEAPPSALDAAVRAGPADVIPFPRRAARDGVDGGRRWGAPRWAAMAACLAAGVLAGRAMVPAGPSVEVEAASGLAADGALARALDRQTAAATEGPIRVNLTFRDKAGDYCRTFEAAGVAGLACRRPGGWSVRVVTPAVGDAATYRMAGARTPPAVLDAVDALIAGDPLDAEAEAKAVARRWRP